MSVSHSFFDKKKRTVFYSGFVPLFVVGSWDNMLQIHNYAVRETNFFFFFFDLTVDYIKTIVHDHGKLNLNSVMKI